VSVKQEHGAESFRLTRIRRQRQSNPRRAGTPRALASADRVGEQHCVAASRDGPVRLTPRITGLYRCAEARPNARGEGLRVPSPSVLAWSLAAIAVLLGSPTAGVAARRASGPLPAEVAAIVRRRRQRARGGRGRCACAHRDRAALPRSCSARVRSRSIGSAAWGARMPWYRSTLIRGRGANDANRSSGVSGSKRRWVVSSRHRTSTAPSGRGDGRVLGCLPLASTHRAGAG
jgi:hypothetical protein